MNGFFVFVFLVFFAGPMVKKLFGGTKSKGKASKWGQTHEQIKKNAYGHSDSKQQTHRSMHSQDGADVFPEEHQAHVRARDLRDQIKNKKMEAVMHGRKNFGIKRAGNKGRSDWGTRGDTGGFKGLLVLIIIGAGLYMVFGAQISDMIDRY